MPYSKYAFSLACFSSGARPHSSRAESGGIRSQQMQSNPPPPPPSASTRQPLIRSQQQAPLRVAPLRPSRTPTGIPTLAVRDARETQPSAFVSLQQSIRAVESSHSSSQRLDPRLQNQQMALAMVLAASTSNGSHARLFRCTCLLIAIIWCLLPMLSLY